MDRLDASADENDWVARVGETYLHHMTSLQGVLVKRLRAPQQIVEDALHDVFCAVLRLRKCPERSREGALSFPYLCAAGMRRTRRVMQQRMRSQRRLEEGALRRAILGASDESDRTAETHNVESLSAQDIERAMFGLTPRQRDVLRMAFSTVGCGRDEARMLGVTAGAHAVEKHRAIVALRRALHVECVRARDGASSTKHLLCGAGS